MGRHTSGKHPFAKTVRITEGVKSPQTNPHLLLNAPSLSSVIHIMDFCSSNCYFWLTSVITDAPSAAEMGLSLKGVSEVWSCARASANFHAIGECFFSSFHLVDDANGRSPLSGIWLRSVTNRVQKENSHVTADTCAHAVTKIRALAARSQTHKQTCAPSTSRAYLLPRKRRKATGSQLDLAVSVFHMGITLN